MRKALLFCCGDDACIMPAVPFIKRRLDVEKVLVIPAPGMNRILYEECDTVTIRAAVQHAQTYHALLGGIEVALLGGHVGCAGNRATKEVHVEQIQQGVRNLRRHLPFQEITTLGLLVSSDEDVELITPRLKQDERRVLSEVGRYAW